MRVLKCLLFSLAFLQVLLPVSQISAQEANRSVGLVLSGGGAKGIAHIGAIKALEENNIPIDYITGTSMGAIVGALYACGYTPEEMMALLGSSYFGYMSQGQTDPAFKYYFSTEPASPELVSFQLGKKNKSEQKRFNPQSVISPMPMAFGFMEIFGAYTAQCNGNFNNLFVPYRSVASNLTKHCKHVFRSGDLGEAVRASMSFPLIFQALEIDGNVFYDGGIFDNFPVDVMRTEFAPGVMIGFDVSASSKGPQNSFMDQLDLLVMQPQSYDLPEEYGIKVRIDLNEFGLLDWAAAKEIYTRGYMRTMEMMDSIKARIPERVSPETRTLRRNVFKSLTPELRFANVDVSGASEKQNEYIKYLFKPASGCDTIGVDRARLAFYRALGSDKLNYLTPHAVPGDSTELFDLQLETSVKNRLSAGAGAFLSSSNNSFLYLRGSYSSLSFNSLDASISAWIGQSYMAALVKASLQLPTPVPSALRLWGVVSRCRYYENEKFFFKLSEPVFLNNHEYYGKLAWAMAAGRTGAVETGIGAGRLYNTFFRNNTQMSYNAGRDNVGLNLGQVFVNYSASTLNTPAFPTSGYSRKATLAGVLGKSHFYTPLAAPSARTSAKDLKWIQLNLQEKHYFNLNRHWAMGVEGEAMLSTRPLLQSYYATISSAPAYVPTQASTNVFNPSLRANSFVAAGIVPIYKYNNSLSLRMSLSGFSALRPIEEQQDGTAAYGKIFGRAAFFGELDAVYTLPFGSFCLYGNYSTNRNKLNFGISFGLNISAPSFL